MGYCRIAPRRERWTFLLKGIKVYVINPLLVRLWDMALLVPGALLESVL